MDIEEMRKDVTNLREFCEDWKKNIAILGETNSGNVAVADSIKHLCRKSNQGNLAKIGLALIAFPFPIIIDDLLGWPLLAAGLVQRKIKNSATYLDDTGKALPGVLKELREIQQKIV
ncbi:hypothetical protein KAU87_00810 [Candidatus Bathyarchaeota archaeon]|nr:hypothetical protein [Candidatus Bathyarchaeota archaeon]